MNSFAKWLISSCVVVIVHTAKRNKRFITMISACCEYGMINAVFYDDILTGGWKTLKEGVKKWQNHWMIL